MNKKEKEFINLIKKENILIFNTDTIPGICCLSTSENSIKKINKIKNRDDNKGHINLVSDIKMLKKYVNIEDFKLPNTNEPTTIIFNSFKNLSLLAGNENGTIAFRLVQEIFLKNLINQISLPIIATSANYSNKPFPITIKDVDKNLIQEVGNIFYFEEIKSTGKPSKIIEIDKFNNFNVIRK